MFHSSSNNAQRSLCSLLMADGRKLICSVKLPLSGKLADALNNTDYFLDAISGDGQQAYIAKSSILRVELANPPQANLNQQRRNGDQMSFDPYAVLGIEAAASATEIRAAYVALVKSYHPDRFANLELPSEMKEYASAMQARINLAYEQLSG